jgi:hypothetical protein
MTINNRFSLLKRRLLYHLGFLTLAPLVAGATLGLGAWAVDARSGLWYFASVALMLLSGLTYVQRVALGWNRDTERLLEAWRTEQEQARERQLDEVSRRLQSDRDARTRTLLEDLRVVTRDLDREVKRSSGWVRPLATETMEVAAQLLAACVRYLEQCVELNRTAGSVNDPGIRKTNLDERERLIKEVQKSLEQLGAILVNVRAINLKHAINPSPVDSDEAGLSRLRNELGLKLQAAREVEQAITPAPRRADGAMRKYIDKANEKKVGEGGGKDECTP